MSNQEEYIKELESRIEKLEGIIDTYVADNSEGKAFMVVDKSTGEHWKGGSANNFSKKGKLYANPSHLKTALRQHCPMPHSVQYPYKGYNDRTKNWQILETATIILKRYTPKEFLGD